MKIKALSRSLADYQPPGSDAAKVPRNHDPALHPFEAPREYTRAQIAAKLERMHAKPFIGQLGRGHVDGVYSIAKDRKSLDRFASGSGDGVVKVWDVNNSDNSCWHTTAHENIVKAMDWTNDQKLLTCAADRTIKLFDPYNTQPDAAPISSWLGAGAFTSLSHHQKRNVFAAACSNVVNIYDLENHTAAPEVLKWPNSVDTITNVAFNYLQTDVLASCSNDRSVVFYDLRHSPEPVSKTVLKFATNHIAWSPTEAFNLATASEDHNIYLFDMRKMDRALNILKDHVAAVMDVEFSPTGDKLVSASWDRTVRLWDRDRGHSFDIYHTKRMQRVMTAKWTTNAKYVLSGSDDGNIRLWKGLAWETGDIKSTRQRQALEYNSALTRRYGHMPEIRRILRHRHVPKVLKKAGEIKAQELKSIKRKEENERKHTKKQFQRRKSEREKMVLALEK
ncbi:hypothetical protein E4U21_005969 [Claviceps maximensis]|nr:hypothetical protein E4U21_005969 [Claviceps maximensis]